MYLEYPNNKSNEECVSALPQSQLSVWYTETTGSVLNSLSTKMPVAGLLIDKRCNMNNKFNIDISKCTL